MTDRKSATVHYRRMEDPVNALKGDTLEARIRSALADQFNGGVLSEHWSRRAWNRAENSDTLLMNIYHDDEMS